MIAVVKIILLSLIYSCSSVAEPGRSWEFSNWSDRADRELFERALTIAYTPMKGELSDFQTDALVIVHRGQIIFEQYNYPYLPSSRHRLWSVSKSFLNALVGVAEKEGYLKRDDPAHQYYSPLAEGRRRDIKVKHILEMSSGLFWKESYSDFFGSTVLPMLFGHAYTDMAKHVSSQPLEHRPGERYVYSSGGSNLLTRVLLESLPEDKRARFPWNALFDRIGIRSATWEQDGKGLWVASSFLSMTPRDLARFGQLYLQDGVWNGSRVLPEGWVAYSSSFNPAFHALSARERMGRVNPGAHWWTNRSSRDVKSTWPSVPESTFAALGHSGQHLFVVPSHELVVVRLGSDVKRRRFQREKFLSTLIESIQARSGSKKSASKGISEARHET